MDTDELKEEILHQRALQKDYRARLRVLERQKAGFGDLHVPAHVQVEIDKLAEKVQDCDKQLQSDKQRLLEYKQLQVTGYNQIIKLFEERETQEIVSVILSPRNENVEKDVDAINQIGRETNLPEVDIIAAVASIQLGYGIKDVTLPMYSNNIKILKQQISEIENL
jgi:hypothetical protein